MGFGCNAAGVVGCRIIDSKRERLIAILTNSFVPCNGRFPTIIVIITIFFAAFFARCSSFISALIMVAVILLGVFMTLLVSKFLSATILKGEPSSFTLELPPYRKPQILQIIVRSIFDRTLFVLARALVVAAPAGLIIWLMANIYIGDSSVLYLCHSFLDPFGKIMGLDGVILLGFILGFPANEIVLPIVMMCYLANGNLVEFNDISVIRNVLVVNGWNMVTAINFILFSLFHWPCSTTCLTIRKETGSIKWTALSFILPTIIGIVLCVVVNLISMIF